MSDGNKIMPTVWACVAVLIILMILIYAGTGNTATKAAVQPPIPKAGPLARPRSPQQVGLPVDQTRVVIPPDYPQTPEKLALGQKLFFDGRLSADGTVACASCHNPERAFTDGKPTSTGIHGRLGQRNAPTILNALYNKTQFWDGRVKTLEEQAALETASHLARDLSARLVLLFAKLVPYPLPLEAPPVSSAFTAGVLSQLAVEQEADVPARVYLCRDRDVTIRHALGPGSLVVMGFRKRWWLNRTPPLARLLKRDGNEVILVGISRFQPAGIGSVNVESTL